MHVGSHHKEEEPLWALAQLLKPSQANSFMTPANLPILHIESFPFFGWGQCLGVGFAHRDQDWPITPFPL